MNVFVESNFVMELALRQGEVGEANSMLGLAERRKIDLKLPAFSLVEPRFKLVKNRSDYRVLRTAIEDQLQQIVRSAGYEDLREKSNDLLGALANKADFDVREFETIVGRILVCQKYFR